MIADRRLFDDIVARINNLVDEIGDDAPLSLVMGVVVGNDDFAVGSHSHMRHLVQSSQHAAMLLATLARAFAIAAHDNADDAAATSFLACAETMEDEFGFMIPTAQ